MEINSTLYKHEYSVKNGSMEKKKDQMKKVLMIVFGIASLWDAFTTLVGTSAVLQSNSMVFSVVAAVVILAFMIGTKYIWNQEGTLKTILVTMWVIALGYDVFTSFTGNLAVVMEGYANESQMAFLIGLTILTSASPILVSIMIDD